MITGRGVSVQLLTSYTTIDTSTHTSTAIPIPLQARLHQKSNVFLAVTDRPLCPTGLPCQSIRSDKKTGWVKGKEMERKAWTGFGLDWIDGCSEWGLCTGGSGNQSTGEPLFPKLVDPLNLASGLESSCSSLSLDCDWSKWTCHVAIGQCPFKPARTVPEPVASPGRSLLVSTVVL